MEMETLFCVKWTPPVDNFFEYIKRFRQITKIPLGGTRHSSNQYKDVTISTVLSIGTTDSKSSLPQRISLSNFKLGTPITSYGCIYRSGGGHHPKYLLIQRRNSVGYVDLIRGCYRESQLFFIVQDLPLWERERLLKYEFEILWYDFHLKIGEGEAFDYAEGIFKTIQPHLKLLFDLIPSSDPEGHNLWLFPKGKLSWACEENDDSFESECSYTQQTPESPLGCAMREFHEETNGLDIKESGRLVFADPIVERFLGSNSKNYQTNYFVYRTDTVPQIKQFERKETPIREVSAGEVEMILWVPLGDLHKYLRPERMELIKYIEENLTNESPADVSAIWKSSSYMDPSLENKY